MQLVQHGSQSLVKVHQGLTKADWISPVAVHGVKVNQVGKAKASKVLSHHLIDVIYPVHVALVMVSLFDAPPRENIVRFADCDRIPASLVELVNGCFTSRLEAKVPPVGGASKMVLIWADVRSGNHPANNVIRSVQQGTGILANPV